MSKLRSKEQETTLLRKLRNNLEGQLAVQDGELEDLRVAEGGRAIALHQAGEQLSRLEELFAGQGRELARLRVENAAQRGQLRDAGERLAAQDEVIAGKDGEIEREVAGGARAEKRRRVTADNAAQSVAEQGEQASSRLVQVKQEGVEKAEAALQRQAQDKAIMQSKAHQVKKIGDSLRELFDTEVDCVVCMERVADTAVVPCGHCFCCSETCGSSTVATCPTCIRPFEGRTKLFGALRSLGGLRAVLACMDAGEPAAGGAAR
ncbi:hypothetical protein T484DRAFT_1877675 [Baffinella frigidus]|nr:hypothetical protein T484DRAFT_1877675 [Cryptophyta sp. CCMP2293]